MQSHSHSKAGKEGLYAGICIATGVFCFLPQVYAASGPWQM